MRAAISWESQTWNSPSLTSSFAASERSSMFFAGRRRSVFTRL